MQLVLVNYCITLYSLLMSMSASASNLQCVGNTGTTKHD